MHTPEEAMPRPDVLQELRHRLYRPHRQCWASSQQPLRGFQTFQMTIWLKSKGLGDLHPSIRLQVVNGRRKDAEARKFRKRTHTAPFSAFRYG